MESKKWVASVLVVLVGSPFAVAALDAIGISPLWEEEVPQWRAGYSWTYANSMEGRFEGSGGWFEEDESEQLRMVGENKMTVVNTTSHVGNVSVYAVVEQWAPMMIEENGEIQYEAQPGDDPVDVDDLDEQNALLHCTIECPTNYAYYTKSDINPYSGSDVSGMGDYQFLKFPLRHGASWSVYRHEESWSEEHAVVEELRARVAGKDVVNLPGVGSMDAIRVEATLTRQSIESMERAMAADFPPGSGVEFDLDTDYRLVYWYAPEAKSIVRSDLVQKQEVTMSFQGETMRAMMSHEAQQILTDYSLDEGPERSMEEVERLRSYLRDLPDVTSLSNETWPFSIASSHFQVDTEKGETATLGIVQGEGPERTTLDFDAVPEGMSLMWRHRYLEPMSDAESDGHTMHDPAPREQWYTGSSLQLSPQSHGLHEVVAYLLDEEGRLVALDSTLIEGYAEWSLGASNPLVNVGALGDHSMPFHANVFMDRVDVRMRADALGSGALYLEGVYSDGTLDETSTMVTGGGELSAGSLNPYLVSSWVAGYSEQASVGDWEMTITLRYDRNAPFEDALWMWENDGRSPPPFEETTSAQCGVMIVGCMAAGAPLEPMDMQGMLRQSAFLPRIG